MKKAISVLFVAILVTLTGCAGVDPGEEEAATLDAGKADGYGYEIVHGAYTNAHGAEVGDLISLTLTDADPEELPAAYYEGRYSLVEQTEDGERASSGFYNAYRYADQLWLRFLDGETQSYETTYEKYSWIYYDGDLVMQGHGADLDFYMEPPLAGSEVRCTATAVHDDNVFEEGLSVDEYPDVSIDHDAGDGDLEIYVGAHHWDVDDGDDIAFAIVDGQARATVTNRHGDTVVVTGPANGTGGGEVVVTEDGVSNHVATLTCTGRTSGAAPTPEPTYRCGGYESPFGVDVSDALRSTPAELVVELTAENAASADSEFQEQLDFVIAREEAADRAAFFANVDEGKVYVYDVSYGQVAYTWLQYFYNSTEAGFIFAAGAPWLEGQVGDGDIRGCNNDNVCEYSMRSPVSETTAGLQGAPRASRTDEITADSAPNDALLAQLRMAVRVLYEEDASAMTLTEVLDYADEGTVYLYDLDGTHDWLMFYAGDTEVGVMFARGTTVPVATVGDTEISACSAVEG